MQRCCFLVTFAPCTSSSPWTPTNCQIEWVMLWGGLQQPCFVKNSCDVFQTGEQRRTFPIEWLTFVFQNAPRGQGRKVWFYKINMRQEEFSLLDDNIQYLFHNKRVYVLSAHRNQINVYLEHGQWCEHNSNRPVVHRTFVPPSLRSDSPRLSWFVGELWGGVLFVTCNVSECVPCSFVSGH